ncbi:TetR/AcrR family transcriptional regulator [Microbacterium sp.]|uniref:TetR/AcrR family transcriptional regulator n=1 Tax=Microbacterium sp. TaxID=51671 RepID=UPI002810E6E4|nr:TetR family transcriptional regulator C-terminal domain-containing protein [Microbacterium sp.]
MSTEKSPRRKRLTAEERRSEIVAAAARIGTDEGLERITLRRVAQEVDVRSGLINHYFPEVEALVATAFAHAVSAETPRLFSDDVDDPAERMVAFLDHTLAPESREIGRLWLNARNVSRYNASLRHAVTEQEQANNARLVRLIEDGVAAGAFTCDQPTRTALLLLVLVDALTGYSNEETTATTPLVAELVFATAEKELGLAPDSLASRSTQLPAVMAAAPA